MPPPSRAKTEISDAPRATPTSDDNAFVSPSTFAITTQNPPTDSNANPTTSRPVTAPPLNAAWSAFFRLTVAPCAVRTLAITASRIPMKPAASEQTAPRTKPTAVGTSRNHATSTVMSTAITVMDRTWRPR